jgi:hypothetical protein
MAVRQANRQSFSHWQRRPGIDVTFGVTLTVLEPGEERTPEQELTDDLVSLIASFSGRLYGPYLSALSSESGNLRILRSRGSHQSHCVGPWLCYSNLECLWAGARDYAASLNIARPGMAFLLTYQQTRRYVSYRLASIGWMISHNFRCHLMIRDLRKKH